MNIHSMTASFGNLEGAVLSFRPGLQVIRAPNGWGKTTWCAFFEAMFYGAEPDCPFFPWSGGAMSGKIELSWQGREITLERDFRKNTFRALDGGTGEPIPELTGETCGKRLLGVTREEYRDLFGQSPLAVPPEEDPAEKCLEAGLTEGLRRYRQVISELGGQIDSWESSRSDRAHLEEQLAQLEKRCLEGERFQLRLERFLYELDRADDGEERQKARKSWEKAAREQERLEVLAGKLPTREEAQTRIEELKHLRIALDAVTNAKKNLDPEPVTPKAPEAFRGLSARQAQEQAERDAAAYRDSVGSLSLILIMLGLLGLLLGCIVAFPMGKMALGLAVMGLGLISLAGAVLFSGRGRRRLEDLGDAYGTRDWRLWPELAEHYAAGQMAYEEAHTHWQSRKSAIEERLQALEQQKKKLCEAHSPEEMETLCRRVLDSWDALDRARTQAEQAKHKLDGIVREEPEDDLGLSREGAVSCLEKTKRDLEEVRRDRENIQTTLLSLDTAESLESRLREAKARLSPLQQYEAALALALETLEETKAQTRDARERQVSQWLDQYAFLLTGEAREDLRNPGSGTVDALAFAACLAKAKVLMPDAPLLLDDCLARLDDERMARAVDLLQKEGKSRQIVLFSCRGREENGI